MVVLDLFYIFVAKLLDMNTRYITDLDFVPKDFFEYQQGVLNNDIVCGYQQILYGILRDDMSLNDIYDLIVRMSKKESVEVVKRFKFMTWKRATETIIKNLNRLNQRDYNVLVNIPFIHYEEKITSTITRFQLVAMTINEILEKGDNGLTINNELHYEYPIKDVKALFLNYLNAFWKERGEDGWEDEVVIKGETIKKKQLWMEILTDEMFRRGINDNVNGRFLPSNYYEQSELYKELFIEKGKELDVRDIEKEDIEEPTKSVGKANNKEKAAVMFYMLQDIIPTTKDNQHEVIALLNYALGKGYKKDVPKVETNNNTIKRYVSQFRNSGLKGEKNDLIDSVRKTLEEYGFRLPQQALE